MKHIIHLFVGSPCKIKDKSFEAACAKTWSGAPNDGFLPNALKRCFRLSGVLLKLCRLIIGCAIKFYLFGHSRGTVVFPNLLGLFCPFTENLRSYCPSENRS